MFEKESRMFHIGLSCEQGAGYAILPGDPGRVERIASYLQQPVFVGQNREYTTWMGTLQGERVLVTSTGIGGPSAAIAVEELAKIGVHTMIRVGTCGGMQTCVQSGDLVIPTGSVRMEGTSKEYIPLEYPAVPCFEVLQALVQAAREQGRRYHTGVIQCKDSFYGQHQPESMPNVSELTAKWQAWVRAGVLASEMETAALFTVAAVRKVRAGALMMAVWNQEREKQGLSNTRLSDTSPAIETAVAAMEKLILQDKANHDLPAI
ncbi:MAG: uridine phosphorylase [Clostridium sp.]